MEPSVFDLIELKKGALIRICEQFEIKSLYIFGSAANGDFHSKSDIDLLISFKDIPYDRYTDNYFTVHEKFEEFFERNVDLITEKSLSNPFFIESLEKSKKLLYAA